MALYLLLLMVRIWMKERKQGNKALLPPILPLVVYHVKADSVYSMLVGLKAEEIEELGERLLDAESLDEIRGWAEENRMARAQ